MRYEAGSRNAKFKYAKNLFLMQMKRFFKKKN